MTKILLYQNPLSQAPKWPPLRQTFMGSGRVMFGRYEYIIADDHKCDYLLACADGVIPAIQSNIPKERRLVILMENPSIWTPHEDYLNYFGTVISPSPVQVGPGTQLVIDQPAVSWFYGLKFRTDQGLSHVPVLQDYLQLNDLAEMDTPKKSKLLSCIVSNKNGTHGHNWRIETAQALKAYFGDAIDMFGFGWNPIADKREAIDPYQYTVAIENECRENYWTEKLSDVVLGYGTPIYSGAPNVNQYFQAPIFTLPYGLSPAAFAQQTAALIEQPIEQAALHSRRHQVLYQYNLFYHVARLIDASML